MNRANVASAVKVTASQTGASNWQKEIQHLYRNYFVIEDVISQSGGHCIDLIKQYRVLQQVITDTLENLLIDLDQSEQTKLPGYEISQVLKRHAVIIKQLNTRVYNIANQINA